MKTLKKDLQCERHTGMELVVDGYLDSSWLEDIVNTKQYTEYVLMHLRNL